MLGSLGLGCTWYCSTVVNPAVVGVECSNLQRRFVQLVFLRVFKQFQAETNTLLARKPLVLPVCPQTARADTRQFDTLSYFSPQHLVGLWQAALRVCVALWNENKKAEMISASTRQVYHNRESKYISNSWTVIDKKICFRGNQMKNVLLKHTITQIIPVSFKKLSRREHQKRRSMLAARQPVNDLIIARGRLNSWQHGKCRTSSMLSLYLFPAKCKR